MISTKPRHWLRTINANETVFSSLFILNWSHLWISQVWRAPAKRYTCSYCSVFFNFYSTHIFGDFCAFIQASDARIRAIVTFQAIVSFHPVHNAMYVFLWNGYENLFLRRWSATDSVGAIAESTEPRMCREPIGSEWTEDGKHIHLNAETYHYSFVYFRKKKLNWIVSSLWSNWVFSLHKLQHRNIGDEKAATAATSSRAERRGFFVFALTNALLNS